jgi:hypothetical protein
MYSEATSLLTLYIRAMILISRDTSAGGLGPTGLGLWTLSPGRNCCPKFLVFERLTTLRAAD